jgi:cycloeucalenol cycloisomerase
MPKDKRSLLPWSENPGKRAAQRLYLGYTPVWGAVCGVVMTGGLAERWGDGPLLALGFGLWIALVALGFALRAPEDRGRPFYRIYHAKLSLFVAVFAFLGNWFGTRYFYEVLDMHYGFRSRLYWNDVPVFLYPLTAVYFTTYAVLFDLAVSWAKKRGVPAVAAVVSSSLLLAMLETALNANPWMARAFCYGDPGFALTFGTVMYGSHFMLAGPLWHRIDERPGGETPLREVALGVLAAMMMVLCADEVWARAAAPFTTVVPGRVGIPGKQGPSCLAPADAQPGEPGGDRR